MANALPVIAIPLAIFDHPDGYYGISYDIGTNATERDLPNGWNAPRGSTYRQLISLLKDADYVRHQYSDYRSSDPTTAVNAWSDMWDLRNVKPSMKFESTVKGCKMHYYFSPALYDITRHIRLGGTGARNLRGMTPAGLVNTAQQHGMLLFPPGGLPQGTRWSANAQNPGNWRV
ncbi:hypothetical protein FPV67DRAFT_1580851 [Lyophyllum atratum]|nr:hypothetical protein FPV67DRAFT_1580851 [Lyophyllum atratum]